MAFELKDSNLTSLSVITDTNNVLRKTPENFISLYDYGTQFQPELIPQLVYANGKGSILGFLRATTKGKNNPYESDMIQHGETNRLHNHLIGVTIAANVFTSPKAHNLRVRDSIKISDGESEFQAIVSKIISETKFEALNDALGDFPTTTVTVMADFSSRFLKGDSGFDQGKKWTPKMVQNYSHIFKEYYEVSDSDLASSTWIKTPQGDKWWNHEMERTSTLFDNKEELTLLFNERAKDGAASTLGGFAQGMIGVIPGIENRGNISNDYIESLDDLSNLALRLKQQGTCRELTMWMDHKQMAKIRVMMSGINASYLNGANYGAFNNSKDMALNLDFVSVRMDGVTFHFVPWAILDDPTLLGAKHFDTSSVAYVGVPTGNMYVTENGNTISLPYLDIRYRKNGMVNRHKQTKFFGALGTQTIFDKSNVEYLTEATNQVVGANNFFVGRKSEGFYV